jgi:hypothetical protein
LWDPVNGHWHKRKRLDTETTKVHRGSLSASFVQNTIMELENSGVRTVTDAGWDAAVEGQVVVHLGVDYELTVEFDEEWA